MPVARWIRLQTMAVRWKCGGEVARSRRTWEPTCGNSRRSDRRSAMTSVTALKRVQGFNEKPAATADVRRMRLSNLDVQEKQKPTFNARAVRKGKKPGTQNRFNSERRQFLFSPDRDGSLNNDAPRARIASALAFPHSPTWGAIILPHGRQFALGRDQYSRSAS